MLLKGLLKVLKPNFSTSFPVLIEKKKDKYIFASLMKLMNCFFQAS